MSNDCVKLIFSESLIVLPPGPRVSEGLARAVKDLPPCNQDLVAVAVLRRRRNPGVVGASDAVAKEMRLGAEDAVEVDGHGDVAGGRGGLGRRESGGCGGGERGRGGVVGGGKELEVGEEAVGPFGSGGGEVVGSGGEFVGPFVGGGGE